MASKRDDIEQIFETCLEQIESGHESIDSALAQHIGVAEELRPRLEAALWLDECKSALDPRPGFISASRNRLVSQMQEEMADHVALETAPELDLWARVWAGLFDHRRYAFHLALAVLVLVFVVLGGTKVAKTAHKALPGDTAYPVKIVLEQAELESNKDPVEQTRLHTEFAQTRLAEAHDLVMEGRYAYIPETVDRFEYHVDEAIRSLNQLVGQDSAKTEAIAEVLHEALLNQATTLNVMIVAIPQQYKLDIERAVSISDNGLIMVEKVLVRVSRPSTLTPFKPISTGNPASSPIAFATSTSTQSAFRMNTTSTYLPLSTSTNTPSPLKTRKPTQRPATSKSTTQPTSAPTSAPTERHVPPTNTPVPPTNTPVPPTNTPKPPTNTSVPPTNTSVPPTDAVQPPTNTPVPPSDTPYPPTSTPTPSTNT